MTKGPPPKWEEIEFLLDRLITLEQRVSEFEQFCRIAKMCKKWKKSPWGLWWDIQEKKWGAHLPHHQDLLAYGDTPEEAMAEVVALWREEQE